MTKRYRINRAIRIRSVRLIGDDGTQFGVVDLRDALIKAEGAGMDLVEVAPNVSPPVCRIMDYSRFKYEQEKKEREAKKKQHVTHLKELKIGPMIGEHDYLVKLHHLERFTKRGDKVKVTMRFRGRQMQHVDLGRNLLDRLVKDCSEIAEVELSPKLDGKVMSMAFKPKG
ncbi:MAG: translation initiation factor IF-3 [Candidatus Omnitrophica bacterium]|nr:translation initiation factor IF-3 [Candidatus Omnitrophota bacterium]